MKRRAAKKGKTKRWLVDHRNDAFVKQAQAAGYRSRAVFKLKGIDEKDRLIRPGMRIADVGAAPGGWSQYAAEKLKGQGVIVGVDLLEIEPIKGVSLVQGDFTTPQTRQQIDEILGDRPLDLVLSDIAPNLTGNRLADQVRSIELLEDVQEFALSRLKQGGNLLLKLFQGDGAEEFRASLKQQYEQVLVRKPDASRDRSREIYYLARNKCV